MKRTSWYIRQCTASLLPFSLKKNVILKRRLLIKQAMLKVSIYYDRRHKNPWIEEDY